LINNVAGADVSQSVSVKRFLVADLDNTLIDSRERFKQSLAEAVGFTSITAIPPTFKIKRLSKDQRDRFYKSFLSGERMDLDVPVKGSVEVLSRLRSLGLGTIYLTGRHDSKEESLKSETLKTLSRFGFPIPNGTDTMLYMKPKKMSPTDEFKRAVLERLTTRLDLSVGVDDEPDDLQVVADFIPLTIGIALSSEVAREIASKMRVPIARDWFEVESIILRSGIIQK
jgi:phosphoglycolate phosphatase-like HAD superfamily hydrolase